MPNETDDYADLRDDDESVGLPPQLRDPLGVFRRQRRWILVTFFLLLIIAAGATAFAPLPYEARATILLTAKNIPDEFVPTTIIANIVEQFSAIQSEVFSRDHLSELIEETGVYASDRSNATRAELVGRLRNDLVVEPLMRPTRSRQAPRSISYQLTMTGQNPKVLAKVVNTAVAHLINENVEYRSRQARLTTEFMNREYERADKALREHQSKLAAFRETNRGALPEDRATAISRLDRLEEQRRSAILRISDYQARLEHLDARPQITGSNEDLESLRAQLRSARTLYTNDHPRVRSLERQVQAIEAGASAPDTSFDLNRQDQRAQIQEGAQSEQLRLSQIDREVARLEMLLSQTPQIAEEYASLIGLEQILQENYVEYLRKVKSSELSLSLESAQQGAQLTRIDPAVPPTSPIIPRWQIAGGGALAALGLSLFVGIIRELVNPVIIDEQHLEDTLSVPLLGSIAEIA